MKKALFVPLRRVHYDSTLMENLISTFGLEGYGMYLILWQLLLEEDNRKLDIANLPDISTSLNYDPDKLVKLVETYFTITENLFYSKELNSELQYYDDKMNRFSKGGKTSSSNMTPEERRQRAVKAVNSRTDRNKNS